MSTVTPIGQPPKDDLDKLLGYHGSIQGTPLDSALDQQREALWEAQAIMEITEAALRAKFGSDWPASVPNYPLALRRAAQVIEQVTGNLEAGVLEDLALEIARAADTRDEERS